MVLGEVVRSSLSKYKFVTWREVFVHTSFYCVRMCIYMYVCICICVCVVIFAKDGVLPFFPPSAA